MEGYNWSSLFFLLMGGDGQSGTGYFVVWGEGVGYLGGQKGAEIFYLIL